MFWSWQMETAGALRLAAPTITNRRREQTIWTNLKYLLEDQQVRG
jgi:hypothetical protein